MSTRQSLDKAVSDFEQCLRHLKEEYGRLQIGRASPTLIENIQIEAYGSNQPLKGVASISVLDGQTLQVQPWDKSLLSNVEKAIRMADLNLNPVNDGHVIRIAIPPLTSERRAELAKVVHKLAEDARISLRNTRHDFLNQLREMEKSKEISEDAHHGAEKQLQTRVDEYNRKIDETAAKKEEEIMKV